MIKLVAGFVFLALLSVIGYVSFETREVSPRQIVDDAVERAREAGPLGKDEEVLLRLQVALADFKVRHGRPPENLSDLIPVYLDQVPLDPKTNQPYSYRKHGSMGLLGALATQPIQQPGTIANKEEKPQSDETVNELTALMEEKFTYSPSNRRDPFLPFNRGTKREIVCDPKEPLRCYKLGQLRVSAVVTDQRGEPVAMLEDELGRGYSARVGTPIGERNGVVASIEPNLVKILQTETEKYTGAVKQNVMELKLQLGTAKDQKLKTNRRMPAQRSR